MSLLLLLSTFSCAHSQSKLNIGLILAPSIEQKLWLGTMDWIKFSDRGSLNFGGSIKYDLSRNIHLTSGVVLYDKGALYRSYLNATQTPLITRTHYSHSWYAGLPLSIGYSIRLNEKSIVFPSIGITYGRVVWKYTITKYTDERNYHNRSYDSTNENYWGLDVGIGMEYQLKDGKSILLRPHYMRQLNRGWDLNPEKTNQGRFDSYVVDFVLFYDWDTIRLRKRKKNESPSSLDQS